jgi:hypothetical protein
LPYVAVEWLGWAEDPANEKTPRCRGLGRKDRRMGYATVMQVNRPQSALLARSVRTAPGRYKEGKDKDAITSNGKDARIPLPPHLVALLPEWPQGCEPDAPVFLVPKYDELLKALKKDLAFAGIPDRDAHGRVFDFPALRKSLGTHLRLAKVDPAVSQLFMRHRDIRLTVETYNDEQLHDRQPLLRPSTSLSLWSARG